ncbi:MAG: replication-associated recombination protein A [Balneolaceae bacterium]
MDLFEENRPETPSTGGQPLATRMRPRTLGEYVGQEHLVSEGNIIHRMVHSGVMGSLIFYGPPSSGKTTLAHVIATRMDAAFDVVNAVLDGVKELRTVVQKADHRRRANGQQTILFVDEIHRWNKAQQDALLPHLESGIVHLIGATTENPFYSLVGPLLSRCQLFELYPLTTDQVRTMLIRALQDEERGLGRIDTETDEEAMNYLAEQSAGDIRNALNALEIAVLSTPKRADGVVHIDLEAAKNSIQKRTFRYDKTGDEHYHYASAFIKSVRGSDADAALYWMNAMLEGGEDPAFLFRRMLILASEDVGMADPYAITVVNATHEAFLKTGMPEGFYFLSHACVFLAQSPKSNSLGAVFDVQKKIRSEGVKPVPPHLKDKTANSLESRYLSKENASEDYKYPHSFDHNWIDQTYLPEPLKGEKWYKPGTEGREAVLAKRLEELRKKG